MRRVMRFAGSAVPAARGGSRSTQSGLGGASCCAAGGGLRPSPPASVRLRLSACGRLASGLAASSFVRPTRLFFMADGRRSVCRRRGEDASRRVGGVAARGVARDARRRARRLRRRRRDARRHAGRGGGGSRASRRARGPCAIPGAGRAPRCWRLSRASSRGRSSSSTPISRASSPTTCARCSPHAPDGIALVGAPDGTTNALSLPSPDAFAPLYGAGSAARFAEHAAALGLAVVSVTVPNLADDVDTLDDLRRLQAPVRAADARLPRLGRASRREGRRPLGRRRRRAVRAGVVDAADPRDVTVIGNVGDDVEVLGLHVSPDLDSILYALAGLNDEERGWGRAGETWHALETVRALGGEGWFALGDRDLGLHLVRTAALRAGEPLSVVTARLAEALGVETRLLPATDERLRTWIDTAAGSFPFQEWFVARGHRDEVDGVRFEGADTAAPAAGVLEAIDAADAAPHRAEQPVRLDRADPRRRRGARGARAPPRPVRRRQPAHRRPRGEGPGRPDAGAARRRNVAASCRSAATRD